MQELPMPQGFFANIQLKETQSNKILLAGGLGVPSSNLGAPTITRQRHFIAADLTAASIEAAHRLPASARRQRGG